MASGQKQYGLLVPKKANQGPLQPRLAIFGDNSDSDNEGGTDWVKKALKRDGEKSMKKQTKLEIERAVAQDPTVYQYDEVYDKMEEQKLDKISQKKDMEKKPRYIQSLLKQAERRKREQERRVDREVQKEREAEGEEFKDKEAFVTSSYRKKIEESQKMDEEEKHQDKIEALTDVSKQKDLSGFYRHLYRQTVGEEQPREDVTVKQEKTDEEKGTSEIASSVQPENSESQVEKKKRQYRKRRDSSSESEKEENSKENKPENLDADSDFTGNSSSSSSDSESEDDDTDEKKKKPKDKEEKEVKTEVFTSGSEEGEIIETSEDSKLVKRKLNEESKEKDCEDGKKSKSEHTDDEHTDDKDVSNGKDEDKENINKEPETPEPSFWEKRTVGAVYDASLERYFARKAAKSACRK
ncbi:hypothetical protein L9F63_003318 [Diploptera punctata]|uniref:Nuclear speckle splicing regulatory protein 1 N-terminal domain-containing protein n=1 Tax=Diploptera punctata TaxID=6984 RepID=A0AAD8E9R6_DIPPU|nr:hypothetical protein L9F63_003318 [Diploptera punctata]